MSKFTKFEQYAVEGWTCAVIAAACAHDGSHVAEFIFLALSCFFVVYGAITHE